MRASIHGFFITEIDYFLQYNWDSEIPGNYSSSIQLELKHSTQVLPAPERHLMTGPGTIRGYKPGLFSADSSVTLRLRQNGPLLRPLKALPLMPFAFIDYGFGKHNDEAGNTAEFLAAGLGLELSLQSQLTAKFTMGVPLAEDLTQEPTDAFPNTIFYGYINWAF